MPLPEPITDGRHLPVCLNGDRLEFTQFTRVVISNNGRWVERHEFSGESWDGASIPRILWSIAGHPLAQEYRWASYWHDRECEASICAEDRMIADAIFLRLLREAGVPKWKRLAMWLAVRCYSIFVWRPKR